MMELHHGATAFEIAGSVERSSEQLEDEYEFEYAEA